MPVKNILYELSKKNKMRVAGLMSGTSADGVDVAVIDITEKNITLLAFETFPYPAALKKTVFELFQSNKSGVADICHFNFVLGETFAEAVIKLCKKYKIALSSIDLIGSHGQTIYHQPKGRRFGKRIIPSTLQIGEAAVIAERTGITTVSDFRPRDMAASGQGAPLVPFADYVLFKSTTLSRAVQNIGGIANVTYLPKNCEPKNIIAFDTGPGNMVIDRLMQLISKGRQKYDRGGKTAARGTVNKAMLNELMKHPFFKLSPPKSTGREQFGWDYCDKLYKKTFKKHLSKEDILATATAFTAQSIADSYKRFLPAIPDEVILCGGGSHNKTLIKMLKQNLSKAIIRTSDEFGISSDAKEAISFAILAYNTIKGIPNNVPSATGANRQLILGKITLV